MSPLPCTPGIVRRSPSRSEWPGLRLLVFSAEVYLFSAEVYRRVGPQLVFRWYSVAAGIPCRSFHQIGWFTR